MNKIFNEDCLLTMCRDELQDNIDLILTSPPYNNSRPDSKDKISRRYDCYVDKKTDEEYVDWSVEFFKKFDVVLKKDGCVLYNISYSSTNPHLIYLVIADIIKKTNFTPVDCIIWKKPSAVPNTSNNKLTRITEFIFVFVRESELISFHTNKKVVAVAKKSGQKHYENILNFIEADNNDGSQDLNKATFSTELVRKLLNIYGKKDGLVYDPFMGTGTTARGAIEFGMKYVGSEISENQILHSEDRLKTYKKTVETYEKFWG